MRRIRHIRHTHARGRASDLADNPRQLADAPRLGDLAHQTHDGAGRGAQAAASSP
jgi:hypothetical protein